MSISKTVTVFVSLHLVNCLLHTEGALTLSFVVVVIDLFTVTYLARLWRNHHTFSCCYVFRINESQYDRIIAYV